MYDDAAINRLLDRSDMSSEAALEQGQNEDASFMKAFKVATFDVVEDDDTPTAGGGGEATPGVDWGR